jgi:hypothetical protein
MMVVSRVLLDPLPWCNGPGMTAEPTKMRLPGIKISIFTALLLPCTVCAPLVLYTNHYLLLCRIDVYVNNRALYKSGICIPGLLISSLFSY